MPNKVKIFDKSVSITSPAMYVDIKNLKILDILEKTPLGQFIFIARFHKRLTLVANICGYTMKYFSHKYI